VIRRGDTTVCRAPPQQIRERHEAVTGVAVRGVAYPGIVEFAEDLRGDVGSGHITVSFRLWKRPRVKVGGTYAVGAATIEVDSIELMPFAAISEADVRRSGEVNREELRRRAAHAGPIHDDTLVYRVQFHVVA
jgi:hypothetical protein